MAELPPGTIERQGDLMEKSHMEETKTPPDGSLPRGLSPAGCP